MSATIQATFSSGEGGKPKVYKARLFFGRWWSWRGSWSNAQEFVSWAEKEAGWVSDPDSVTQATASVTSPDGTVERHVTIPAQDMEETLSAILRSIDGTPTEKKS